MMAQALMDINDAPVSPFRVQTDEFCALQELQDDGRHHAGHWARVLRVVGRVLLRL
jgi:hypothetical protein